MQKSLPQKDNTDMAEKHSRVLRVLHTPANDKVLATSACPVSWEDIHSISLKVYAFLGVR